MGSLVAGWASSRQVHSWFPFGPRVWGRVRKPDCEETNWEKTNSMAQQSTAVILGASRDYEPGLCLHGLLPPPPPRAPPELTSQ